METKNHTNVKTIKLLSKQIKLLIQLKYLIHYKFSNIKFEHIDSVENPILVTSITKNKDIKTLKKKIDLFYDSVKDMIQFGDNIEYKIVLDKIISFLSNDKTVLSVFVIDNFINEILSEMESVVKKHLRMFEIREELTKLSLYTISEIYKKLHNLGFLVNNNTALATDDSISERVKVYCENTNGLNKRNLVGNTGIISKEWTDRLYASTIQRHFNHTSLLVLSEIIRSSVLTTDVPKELPICDISNLLTQYVKSISNITIRNNFIVFQSKLACRNNFEKFFKHPESLYKDVADIAGDANVDSAIRRMHLYFHDDSGSKTLVRYVE